MTRALGRENLPCPVAYFEFFLKNNSVGLDDYVYLYRY